MKSISRYLALGFITILMGSCAQKFKVETPEIGAITYDREVITAGGQVIFSAEVNADYAVIWSGTAESDYDRHLSSPSNENTGLTMTIDFDKLTGVYTATRSVSYPEAGTFKVVIVASNVGDLGETIEQVTKDISVTVVEAPVE